MKEEIVAKIKASTSQDAEITFTGEECSLSVTVVSSAFEGLNTLKRHRLINNTMKEDILNGKLHALSIKTFTPQEAKSTT